MRNKTLHIMMAVSFTAALGWGGAAVYSTEAIEAKNTDKARLCKIYNIENPAQYMGGACASPAYENEGGLCVTHSKVHNAFSYIIKEDESLDFGLSYWFAGGAHCGIIGNATQTEAGWRYENNMGAADSRQRCAFDIKMEGNLLVFDADQDATCRMECGAQARLLNITMPLSALESRDVTPESFNPEVFFNTPCK